MQVRISSIPVTMSPPSATTLAQRNHIIQKLLQISRVVSLIDEGSYDEQFCVAEYSSALYSHKYGIPDSRSLVVFASKGDSADEFWDVIRRLRRPTIFLQRENIHRLEHRNGARAIFSCR